MKIYLASVRGSGYSAEVEGYFTRDSTPFEKEVFRNCKNILESYLYMDKGEKSKIVRGLLLGRKIVLDSGAYSAKAKGIAIDIDDYISFIYKYKNSFRHVVNLDVIQDPKQSLKNQRTQTHPCLLYTSPSPRDRQKSRMPSSA